MVTSRQHLQPGERTEENSTEDAVRGAQSSPGTNAGTGGHNGALPRVLHDGEPDLPATVSFDSDGFLRISQFLKIRYEKLSKFIH